METYRIGIDIGSTTMKVVVLDKYLDLKFSKYVRHNAQIKNTLFDILDSIAETIGECKVSVSITGSIGMGIAEKCSLPFSQEVISAAKFVEKYHPEIKSMIDIGGEDAKIVFFSNGKASDLRMNGNCAGGTGAFIDQMSLLLGLTPEEMDEYASRATQIYPIASRCGVFCKTDIQNLIAKNAKKEDIAASVFHAVAVQTVVTLSHGTDISTPLIFSGGPLTFLKSLRQAFFNYLGIDESKAMITPNSHILTAWGTALQSKPEDSVTLTQLRLNISEKLDADSFNGGALEPLFADDKEYEEWKESKPQAPSMCADIHEGKYTATLGIDSGSTTTKIVIRANDGTILYSYYTPNKGNPIDAVNNGLSKLVELCRERNAELTITGGCSTGYGEDLIKSAFKLNNSIVETMAHTIAAKSIAPNVSFILDIGGQDMKAIFIDNGAINRIEINEACSSGCGSFIETFARSMKYDAEEFSRLACTSQAPCDLGTRCTVFMNSKVKQVLREGASVADISAGLSYSVVKNCLYKVLQLKNIDELGEHLVLQGGTMRNDSVVRAFEKLTGKNVYRSKRPELMGALGCAIYAAEASSNETGMSLTQILGNAEYETKATQCKGCENSCRITTYKFKDGKRFYSGNRCEKIFTNSGADAVKGTNAYTEKEKLLFSRAEIEIKDAKLTIGIPRCLNMYEEFPFWHKLFTECGLNVTLSGRSSFIQYEQGIRQVTSDNICFPAKLVHSHINDLINKKVDRIFMPFVLYEKNDGGSNSFNCPIVSGYSSIIKNINSGNIKVDTPAISFKDEKALLYQCTQYLKTLGVNEKLVKKAFLLALDEKKAFEHDIAEYNKKVLEEGRKNGRLTILLAGRPYHTDQLIQHKLSDMIASMGADVITDDIVRGMDIDISDAQFVPQWSYPTRILKAAKWVSQQGSDLQLVQMTSFGCGPDAFLVDEVGAMLRRMGKTFTILKIDDVCNIGSLKLRVRSIIESLKFSNEEAKKLKDKFLTTPIFTKSDKKKKIIAPFFTPFISPLVKPIMKYAGYDVDSLPMSSSESVEYGLKYANNEVCYPATLIVGDIIRAFKSGEYDPKNTTAIITQTGGQCRASNYISLIKKALVSAGYGDVSVISLTMSGSLKNEQPGFKVNWLKVIPLAFSSILYSDCLASFYHASVVREKTKGAAKQLLDKYLDIIQPEIEKNNRKSFLKLLAKAAEEFNAICKDKICGKVGIVGEIYLKFNPFAHHRIADWLAEQGLEVVPPMLTDFFMQNFVNRKTKRKSRLEKSNVPMFISDMLYKIAEKQIKVFNKTASAFRYFTPIESIQHKAKCASEVISLNVQFGEGWLLPAEVISMAKQNINHVISLQPFGCIANQIISKGMEKRIKELYPDMQMLSLDFDGGISEVNMRNRLLLFVNDLIGEEQKVQTASL